MLWGIDWQLVTEVSGNQSIAMFKGQAVKEELGLLDA
jgi:hypothetical protein